METHTNEKMDSTIFKYQLGDIVYLITDEDQKVRMVVGAYVSKSIKYEVKCGTTSDYYYDFEITKDKKFK